MGLIKNYDVTQAITGIEKLLNSGVGGKTENLILTDMRDWLLTQVSAVDKNYVHTQSTPATKWNISHQLNKKVIIEFRNGNGEIMLKDYTHVDDNNAEVIWDEAEVGTAICN